METSKVKHSFEKVQSSSAGLTLIEVLIALAIIAIAMTAIIKAVAQNIQGTTYLQNKTIAFLISQEFINEARTLVYVLPEAPDELEQKVDRLGQTWVIRGSQESTPNARIKKIKVNVFAANESTPIVSMESYVYQQK